VLGLAIKQMLPKDRLGEETLCDGEGRESIPSSLTASVSRYFYCGFYGAMAWPRVAGSLLSGLKGLAFVLPTRPARSPFN
jgi:hypothetical protein